MDNQVYQFNQESWSAMGMDPEQQIDDQAYMALRLSKKLNEQPEIVAADLDKAAQNSLPVNLYKTLDNRELPDNYTKEMLSKSISPLLKRTIATSPERAAYFTKEQLEKWNAVAREAEAFRRHQNYIDSILQQVEEKEKAKSPEEREYERWMSVRDARKRQETWKQIQDQAQINKVVNALDAYWPDDFRKAGDRDLQARLEILNTMGIDTSMVDLDELRKTKGYQFREAVNLFGVLNAMENGENLGWLLANKMTGGDAVNLLSHVDENSPLFVQEKALELLRKERYDAMPETGMEKAFNSVFASVRYMTELALTSGVSEAMGLVKAGGAPMLDKLVKDGFLKFIRENGLKGFGQAVMEDVKRSVGYGLGHTIVTEPITIMDTLSEVSPSVVTVPDDFGNPSITVKESDVTDFIQRLVTNTVEQFVEASSENLGSIIPLGDLDAKMVTAFLPKTVRNFVAQNLIRNPTTRRIAERAILDRVPFDGLIGEFGEEAIGQFMMFGATLLGYGMGFRPENTPGVMSPIMSKEEAGDTLASIALQSVLFRGLQIAHAEFTNRGAIAMIRDAQRAKSDRTHFEAMRDLISETRLPQSNVNEAERTLGLLLNGDAVVSVTPESLEGILQQATEGKTEAEANEARATLEQLGVTTDAIENAKKNGTDVLLSRNRLWAVSSNKGFKNAKELVDRILDNEVSEVFGKTTKEITADGFTKEQIDEMVDRSKRQEDFLLDAQKTMVAAIRTAQKNAIAAGNKLGISQQNVQDFVNIYKWMANYLAENVETEEGLAKLKEMVDNLSVQFAEAPEKFDTTAARDALGQVSPVWTGSAASYDRPSLQYVGTGEGAQVYGWGLYGSSRRSVAEWYAKEDAKRKSREDVLWDGKSGKAFFREMRERGVSDTEVWNFEGAHERLKDDHGDVDAAIQKLKNSIELAEEFHQEESVRNLTRRIQILEEYRDRVKYHPKVENTTGTRNLYKQTFWPDKEENLLNWDNRLTPEQVEQIQRQLDKEHVFDEIPKDEEELTDFARRGNREDNLVYLQNYLPLVNGESILEGKTLYYALEKALGSPKAASEFLYRAGIDGMTYIGDSSGVRNYVAFSDKDIRVDEHLLFQNDRVTKGQINLAKFAESQQAIITLFKDADASTLPHESAHWLKAAMEALVGAGFANEKMQADLQTIKDWLAKQDYTGMDEAARKRAEEEYFARAFEQYLREGRFPEAATNGLKAALRRLARVLQSIYRSAVALNAPIDDSIREFFDDIFAVDEVVDGTSVLSGILREINGEAIAMGKDELKKLEAALEGAKEDAETEAWLAALKAYQKGLREQKTLWRNQAKEAYAASKAEAAYNYVRNGHRIDENFLRNVLKLDEDTITILRKKRLTYKGTVAAEAPAAAETSAEAAPTPAVAPEATPAAENVESTPLDGTPEQFSGLADDAYVSLPVGEEVAQNAVANLVYGPDGKGGMIWKKINVNPAEMELGDVLYKIYTVALQRLSEAEPITKKGLLGYLSRTAFTSGKQALRDKAKQAPSMDEAVYTGEDGDTVSRYDVTQDERSMRAAYDTSSEAYLTALSDFTETLADGTLKREIADIIYELSDAGEQATNEAIMAEYRQRGGTRQKTSLYDAIKEVRRSIRDYMRENGFLQSLDVETPASILDTMKELDYGDVNDLITDLKTAMGRSAFIKDYMNRKHAEYRNAFLDNPNWASEAGATRYLDAILRALKVTEGMKFSERARIAASEATRELMASANVRDVMNGERGVATSLRSNAAKVLRALKSGKEDKAAAITAALDMYRNDARLRAIRKLRADIQKTLNRAKRIGKSKPGSTLDGDTINAVKALLNRFGMSSAEPQWTTGPGDPQSVLAVMKEFTPDLEAELTHWSPWMNLVLTGEEAKTSWQNLTPEQFYELTDLIDYLRGEGRQSLMDQKGTFASNLRTAMEAILPSVEEHKTGDYTDPADKTMLQKLGSLARSGIHQMKTLVFMAHLLDGRTEFYGDHVIGPVRKFFQLPLSEGASRELFWYQKTSKEIMPHLQALMRSAKERNLLFAVNNPDNRSYTELRGETAAFVLLNAGAVENRQRLMESFGWSEDELNGLLAQFTKEDFENAEAIWKSLNEMGQELAKVYYRERHYRMTWATPSPISLTLNDGTEILSEGGYYPIAYAYHDSTKGYDPDIMNPFTKPNKPSRPAATFGRTPVLSDLSLLMSPAVVDRSVRENAHYIGMWEPLRMANAIWTNKDFKQAVIKNFSKETYDALKQLMDNVNNPDKGDKGLWKQVANKLGACLATTALGFKITTMAKQYASVTIGAERLGDYFHDAVSFALRDLKGLRRFVNEESPFMRDRYNLMDRDLRVVNTEFKKPIAKAADKYRYAAFWGLKQNDLNVAAVQWYAAFNWALDPKRGMTKDQARAYADDFVASTQGAARTIDTPVVQLETLGRLMTPFFGPACAAANTRLAGLSVFKQMDAGERIAFAVDNFLVPGLVMTLVAAVRGGLLNPDDDDDWDRIRKQSLIALLTEPVSGLPLVQDIADGVVRAAVTGRPAQGGVFEVSLFRPAEDVSREFVNMFRYWNELGYTTYAAASITGMLFGMPVVQVYEDYEKMILWNFGDEGSKTLKKQLQGEKRK